MNRTEGLRLILEALRWNRKGRQHKGTRVRRSLRMKWGSLTTNIYPIVVNYL